MSDGRGVCRTTGALHVKATGIEEDLAVLNNNAGVRGAYDVDTIP